MSDNENEETSTEDSILETLGQIALHIAACKASSSIVELPLSKGADANATDYDLRAALMEAALWGRLETAEALLEYGAEKSMTCIDGKQLRCAADFAKPPKQNVETRRIRAGGGTQSEPICKKDTYARGKDREDIDLLPEDAEDKPGTHQLDAFFFQYSPNDRTMLSLTTHYNLHNEWKIVAYMMCAGLFPEITAVSGWSHAQSGTIHVAGRYWTEEVLRLYELPVPEEPAEQSCRKEERQYKMKPVDLREASSSNTLKEAEIIVSNPLCDDCRHFVAKVNHVLGLELQLIYRRCLEASCNVCPN
ncbi:hypothetical protein F4814DRAFT_454992 [Daldinia grandis]|nr:hypothetical protein F4814DRAFT_454992 [Daldinia grandis]